METMQDSIEDYIKISKNTKEGPPPQSKQEVLLTAQIKKECDAKAMQILQFAIEGKMRPDALFRCLPHINQSHYQDIVEERAITKLCGYPLCSKKIPDMPKKQFYISTKNNKVYDITDRKNYCSNFCYRASLHIKKQIDTSPLWLRKHIEKTHFTLLNKSEKGIPGEVVDQGIRKAIVEPLFTSVHTFAEMSLDEAEENEINPQEQKESKSQLKKPKKFQKNTMKTINENEEEEQGEIEHNSQVINDAKESQTVETVDVIKMPEEEIKENKMKLETAPKANTNKTDNVDTEHQILAVFKEWLTLETYMFIYGEEKVREKLDSEKLSDYFETLKIAELQVEQQKRYVDICRKLHLKELAEEKFHNDVTGNSKLYPIPDYQQLKAENKELDVKVKSFYTGELHIKEDTNFPTKKKESDASTEEGPPVVLPLVDVNSQNALRRKIFLNSLNKTVQTLLQTLRISPDLVLSDLQALVKTFKLKADNIVFKPPIWNYIAIILLKMLSLKDENLRSILEEDRSKLQINLWMSSLPHKTKLTDEILKVLQDIDTFVENYIICK